ncbi:MAG: type II-A CRISPR-associated protein Csn2 [Clostridiales bacterium]|nr:type II-A CRISPR-associated protein Csn2 [Clostridiales bacterium]
MMVAFDYLNKPIDFFQNNIHILVLENKRIFTKILLAFENDNIEDYMIFSKDYQPFKFNKYCEFISNPICPRFDNKKLSLKINSYLENLLNDDYFEELSNFKNSLTQLALNLSKTNDFDFTFHSEIDAKSIIKLLDFSISTEEDDAALLLVRYITLAAKYLKTELFVIANLHLYFSDTDIDLIYKTLTLNKINLLLVECIKPTFPYEPQSIHIVDSDLCIIDN